MKKVLTVLIISILCVSLAWALSACGKKQEPADEQPAQEAQPTQQETIGNPIVQFEFHTGDVITVELFAKEAPVTVINFLQYVAEDFYKGTVIHRVSTNVVQGGGYVYRNGTYEAKAATHDPIVGEFASNNKTNNVSHTAGTISMARTSNNKNSATSQFFFCPVDSTGWDGDYAAFGRVVDESSLAAIKRMSNVQHRASMSDGSGEPIDAIIIKSVKILQQ